ncbi:MAG: CAP domain-containing protein [Pseudonocardiaceae bacterium]
MIKLRWKHRLAFIVPLVAVSVGPLGATPSAAALEYSADAVSVSRALTLVNQERAEAGCSFLRVVPGLQAPAQRQSGDQATRDGFGHNGADGSTVDTRLSGLGYSRWGENVVQAQSARAAVHFWSHSPRHRANMLNCVFTQTGLAMARSNSGKRYWTQTFGG